VGLASEEIAAANRGEGPLGKAAPDEPVFILRAQDMFSCGLVEAWACAAEQRGVDAVKVKEARQLAVKMRAWPKRRIPD